MSAIAGDPQRCIDFYSGILGLRLVKRTVNFDDPHTYHLYFGDATGTPGTLMTFFPSPGARRGRQGAGQVAVTSFAISPESIGFWIARMLRHGLRYDGLAKRAAAGMDEQVISLRDHDGAMLELVASPGAVDRPAWGEAPGIPAEHAVRGLHRVTLWVEEGEATQKVLADVLGFRPVGETDGTRRFAAGDGGPGMLLDLRVVGGFPRGVGGAGTVHHVAFTVTDRSEQLAIRDRAVAVGLNATAVIDRRYFESVYFREPGGVLFELATAEPGFTIDEPTEALGTALMLPPQYEPRRAEIEAQLPPIHLHSSPTGEAFILDFIHRFVPPQDRGATAAATTLLLLHGTGGDEEDLIPLGRTLMPGAALLSPRGKVREGGAPRFFRRLAEGVFDLEDLALRTDELGQFVEAAASVYGLDSGRIVAVGFSNGANIAASLMLRRPGVLQGAVLLSPMVPFEPEDSPDLAGTAVFIAAGKADQISPPEQAQRLADLLRAAGADVTLQWHPGGHQVTREVMEAAQEWLATRS